MVSPVASTFQGAGLAPRPPSLPYGQNNYPPELAEKRRRRSARYSDDHSQEAARATPPAAPEIPKAPPVSYKDPLGEGRNSPYTFNAAGQPGPPPSAHRAMAQARAAVEMEPEPSRLPRRYDEDLETKRARRAMSGHDGEPEKAAAARRPSNGERLDRTGSSRRRESVDPDGQRKTWADDRSPLQRLELTLDSITKEEKRARVEAAERRAREKASRAAVEAGGDQIATNSERPTGQQVRFKDRREPESQAIRSRPIVADALRAHPPPATQRDYRVQDDPARQIPSDRAPRSHRSATQNRNVATDSTLPTRNLSFKERAVKNDMNVAYDTEDITPEASPVTPPGGGLLVARSASNKLKKNPPAAPKYGRQVEAEERQAFIPRHPEPEDDPIVPSNAGVARSRSTGSTLKKAPPTQRDTFQRSLADDREYDHYDGYEEPPSRARGFAAAIGLGRSVSVGNKNRPPPAPQNNPPSRINGDIKKSVKFPGQGADTGDATQHDDSDSVNYHHHFRDYFHQDRTHLGQSMYQRPKYLEEWRKATVGTLSGALLDIRAEVPARPEDTVDKDTAWWEGTGKKRDSMSSRPKKAEAFDGEYDDTQTPSRFKPQLYLKCGPLLRYCGIREEKSTARNREDIVPDKEIWRGSVMIVTQDSESSYDIVPILRLFVQPIDLLPPPPAELKGEQALLPEYVDPIAGIPKLGRRGETMYVRPVEHLEEAKDVSMAEPEEGLFEVHRTAPDFDNAPDPPGSFASRRKRIQVDGEKLGKYKDVRGFRLHAERGCTFWRFNIEVELTDKQQRIAYRINRGPSTGFWVPARGQSMNVMFHSCNGFSLSVKPDELSGPDPMWRDVLNTHQTQPFHVMIGGGDQVYMDAVTRQTTIFQEWLGIKNTFHKRNVPFTAELQDELESFYLDRYSMWFSQGLFGLANSQIPMVNMYDDHDIIDGFGSYPDHSMKSPVFSGLGNVAFKYYMLFQQQSVVDEGEDREPSWVLGCKPGPYIQELSRNLYMSLGAGMALLAVDARTERTRDKVMRDDTWKKLMDRCYAEIEKDGTRHLLVLLGVPIAYPRLVWLENILTSRLMDPVKALGKAGMLGNLLNRFDGGVEVLDDLDDHWTSKNHKEERQHVIEDLQDLAADTSVRITILSGDVHLAAIGQFYSNPKLHIPKHKDFRYMPNVISSAIVNTPPPDLMADVLNKRNKVHHFDKETDENMIPIFTTGVDGKSRNNKHLLPHRNWCQIRSYVPGSTPPPTPPPEDDFEYTPEQTPPGSRGGLFRKFSLSKQRGPAYRPDVPEEKDRTRPPVSGGGGLLRSFSRRGSASDAEKRPNKLSRTLSLGRGDSTRGDSAGPKRGFFGRRPSAEQHSPDNNGNWGGPSEEDLYTPSPPVRRRTQPTAFEGPGGTRGDKLARMGLRGGAGNPREAVEYTTGDDSYFSVSSHGPRRVFTEPTPQHGSGGYGPESPPPTRPFHRTPTGLSVKQLKRGAAHYEVDIEGALEIQLNVEVNPRDPAGITVPYRLLVPKLDYEYQGEDGPGPDRDDEEDEEASVESPEIEDGSAGIERPPPLTRGNSLKRWFSNRKQDFGGGQYRERRDHGSEPPWPEVARGAGPNSAYDTAGRTREPARY